MIDAVAGAGLPPDESGGYRMIDAVAGAGRIPVFGLVFEKILPNFLCIIPSPYICALFTFGVPDVALFGRVFADYFVFFYGKI
jgi:hypothetical protein